MKINIKLKGEVKLTDDLSKHINDKLNQVSKYLKRYNLDELFVDVELGEGEKEKERKFRADITASIANLRLHAVGWGENLFAAIDDSKNELSRRIRREKRKSLNLIKKTGKKIKSLLRRNG